MTETEYMDKKAEVLSRFQKEFIEGFYLYDPTLNAIVEVLINGASPYQIIEELIKRDNGVYKKDGKLNL